MSVDTLRETFHINRISNFYLQDFLTAQTYRPEITAAKKHILGLNNCTLQSVCTKLIQQGKSPKYSSEGLKCLKPRNTNTMLVSIDDIDWIDISTKEKIQNQKVSYGDILITRSGSGTIGRASIYPYKDDNVYVNDHLFIVRPDRADSHYVCSYLGSYFGQRLLEAGISGSTGQLNLSNQHIKSIRLFEPDINIQKYIGDKVRQAEQLRAWAKELESEIEQVLNTSEYLVACNTPDTKISHPTLNDLSNRLDPKYYDSKAIAVERFTKKSGTLLGSLIKSIANGFEERNFVNEGVPYITVTEVSSGRLNVQDAPQIGSDISIPSKATIHERCVLVVRTGSIGTAIKVNMLDKGCAISSHLIRLEFEEEETAAAVSVFLNSTAGKILLHKISYGAVQPQIGQEELLALYIPDYVLNKKTTCLTLLENYELTTRASESLIRTAKTLVEALIESQLTEEQLIQAQQTLEDGDNTLDKAILSKLSNEGYAVEGAAPLFSDIDELYRLLASANAADDSED